MYSVDVNPLSDDVMDEVYQSLQPVQPTQFNVQMPQVDYGNMGGVGGGSMFGGEAGQNIGSAAGKFLRGEANDAGGFGNMMTNWSEGTQAGWQKLKEFMAPTSSITPQTHAPITPPSSFGIGTPSAGLEGLGGMAGGAGATGAAASGAAGAAGGMMPFVGPAMNLMAGKKKSAMTGALGTAAGFALIPVLGPLGPVVGGALGSMFGGGE